MLLATAHQPTLPLHTAAAWMGTGWHPPPTHPPTSTCPAVCTQRPGAESGLPYPAARSSAPLPLASPLGAGSAAARWLRVAEGGCASYGAAGRGASLLLPQASCHRWCRAGRPCRTGATRCSRTQTTQTRATPSDSRLKGKGASVMRGQREPRTEHHAALGGSKDRCPESRHSRHRCAGSTEGDYMKSVVRQREKGGECERGDYMRWSVSSNGATRGRGMTRKREGMKASDDAARSSPLHLVTHHHHRRRYHHICSRPSPPLNRLPGPH